MGRASVRHHSAGCWLGGVGRLAWRVGADARGRGESEWLCAWSDHVRGVRTSWDAAGAARLVHNFSHGMSLIDEASRSAGL